MFSSASEHVLKKDIDSRVVSDSCLGNGVGGIESPAISNDVDVGCMNVIKVVGLGSGGKVIVESNIGGE
eukprot:14701286-Heterocapsa_arctica.AAC.1